MKREAFVSLPLEKCVLCCSCGVISNSTGDRCHVCDGIGGLMNLQRILDGEPFSCEYAPGSELLAKHKGN